MRRRDKAAKRPKKLKRRNAPKTANRRTSLTANKDVAQFIRERDQALEQLAATSEILGVIRRSPANAQPVFDAICESASRLCEAMFSVVWRYDGDLLHYAASHNFTPEVLDHIFKTYPKRPDRSVAAGRAILDGRIAHVPDMLADPGYAHELALAGNWRATVAVPMLRDGKPVGAISVGKAEAVPFSERQMQLLTAFADPAVIAIENVRLFNETKEALEQQTATSEVLKVISSSPGELEPVFNAVLANATRICEAAFGNLFLREGPIFRAVARQSQKNHADILRRRPVIDLRDNPGIPLDRIATTKQIVHIPDLRTDQSYIGKNELIIPLVEVVGIRTYLVVPMLKEGELIGAIGMYREEVRPFTDKQIELVQNFAAQAVIATENTRLLNELRESLQQQTATADVLEVISRSAFDLQPIFETVAESAVRLCGADKAFILRFDGELLHPVVAHNASPELTEFMRQNPIRLGRGSTAGRAALERRTTQIPDVMADPEYTYGSKAIDPVRTVLAVPMLKGDELLGVILTYRLEVKPFSEKQIALVETFADQAVIAIENVRLFDEVQARTRDLSESLQQQTATSDVLKVISRSAFDLQTVLQTLVESAARLCDADQATILREKDGAFYRAEAYGFTREFMDYVKDIPIQAERGSASGRALLEGRVVHIADVKADPEYTLVEAQRLGDYRTILCVPMLREGAPIGVMILTRSEVRPFTDKQIELVTTFADQAAIAIENVRLFESVEARTRELAASLDDLRTTQDRLVQTQKLASLGQLTAGIAHEIKNPLNFVNNFSVVSTELIDELQDTVKGPIDDKARAEIKALTDTLKENLDKVVQHGKRADAIVKNMLLHSREGAGEHRLVDINALVEESLNLAYHGARAEKQGFNITLERSFDPAAGEVDIFPQEITRALLNLISNGFYAATKRKADANGGDYEPTLTAATKSLGDRVEIRIRDNGTGVPPEVREKMFNPFFTTKPAGEGTGLGLSISHDIVVKQHAGSIEVDTQPGKFTEIRIVLPRVAVH
jgi:two-component system, NtrC family, sensor kinase